MCGCVVRKFCVPSHLPMAFTKLSRLALIWALSILAMWVMPAVAGPPEQWPELVPMQVRPAGSYLGLRLADIDKERAKALKLSELSGVEIEAVEEGGPADQAGLRASDVILSYNGEKVLGVQQFKRLVMETPPERRVTLVCWRAGARKELSLTTGEWHYNPSSETLSSSDELEFSRMRISDVPLPMMLWRNLVLGVESLQINDQLAQALGVKQGILIWTVTPAYPAQHAGLRAGDVLTGFCGHPIHSPRELGVILQQSTNGQKPASLELVRDHKTISISIPPDGDR